MTITALTPQKNRPHRTSVFVDGTFAFGMDNADLVKHTLSEGMEITKERLNHIYKHVICIRARDTALRYLSTRARSRCEVEKKLTEEGYPTPVVNYVLTLMLKYRYINDAEYAMQFTESRCRQNYGRYRIKQELKQKGIDENHIETALCKIDFDTAHQIRDWLRRKKIVETKTLDPVKKKRLINALMRRGFSYRDIKSVLDMKSEDDECFMDDD